MQNSKANIRLSICIPTYNRARFIGETLQSVISQSGDSVEIVIVDGSSTDNTAEVVNGFKNKFPNLRYYCVEKNMGVDRDMARTIELSTGEYCWMLSDDDTLRPGAIDRITTEIESGCEIYLCNVMACDLSMTPLRERFWLSREVEDRIFDFREKKDLIEYCNKAKSIGALFSFMSSVVLRREAWIRNGYPSEFDRSAYALAASLLAFIGTKCSLKYIREPLVFWRTNNESFQNAGGIVKRYLLDFDGYLRLADRYLAYDQEVRDSFLKVMTREHPWYTIIHVTSNIDLPEEWLRFKTKMLEFGYSQRLIQICYAVGRYKNLVSIGVKIKRAIVRNHQVNAIAGLLCRK